MIGSVYGTKICLKAPCFNLKRKQSSLIYIKRNIVMIANTYFYNRSSITTLLSQNFKYWFPICYNLSTLHLFFSNSDHVGWRSGLSDTILEGDHPQTISPKFGLKWPSGFRENIFSNIVDRRTKDAE